LCGFGGILQGNQGFPCDPFLLWETKVSPNTLPFVFRNILKEPFEETNLKRKGRAGKPWFPCEEGAEEYCEGGLFIEEWVGGGFFVMFFGWFFDVVVFDVVVFDVVVFDVVVFDVVVLMWWFLIGLGK
jgi:hypothetical protein